MLTDKQLTALKKLLLRQQQQINENENDVTSRTSLRDATDELSTIDNHPADLATEMHEREKDIALTIHHEDTQSAIADALDRIENGSYGQCLTCQASIPYDRLRAIPYTAYCIEHAEKKTVPTDRPIEEDLLRPAVDNSFANRDEHDLLQDDEDSFRIVAQYGSSDTPSDFEGDFNDYNDLYNDTDENSDSMSELDTLHIAEHEQLGGQVSQSYVDAAKWDDYTD